MIVISAHQIINSIALHVNLINSQLKQVFYRIIKTLGQSSHPEYATIRIIPERSIFTNFRDSCHKSSNFLILGLFFFLN